MAKYLIHSCQKRKWYVDDYLIPSMLEQDIKQENILVYNDSARLGNLRAFLASSEMIEDDMSGTWHLQDDVIISSWFKRITEEFNKGIVCGFCNDYSKDSPSGLRPAQDMWYSFPCIRIPNHILKSFIEWLLSSTIQSKYQTYIRDNKFDDTLFRKFILEQHGNDFIINLNPNIVDNVDYLLGGSIINYQRNAEININSLYFDEPELIENLKMELFAR